MTEGIPYSEPEEAPPPDPFTELDEYLEMDIMRALLMSCTWTIEKFNGNHPRRSIALQRDGLMRKDLIEESLKFMDMDTRHYFAQFILLNAK